MEKVIRVPEDLGRDPEAYRPHAETFPEEGCVFFDIPRGQFLEVQILHDDLFKLLHGGHRVVSWHHIS
ncbi:MAG: hypothetical protein ACXWXD_08270, partial [Candidatus Deferrimicrobiaceae bacterium]